MGSNIVLVGFMGTGKSTVGRLLAQRLKMPFVDLDRRIEKEAGKTIPEIFGSDGEAAFRARETQAVQEVSRLSSHVIATGGGVMCDERNVEALKASGLLVCLTASPEVILARTMPTLRARPLLAGADPKQRIEQLLALRTPYYARADLTIDTTGRSPEEIEKEIRCKLETFRPSR